MYTAEQGFDGMCLTQKSVFFFFFFVFLLFLGLLPRQVEVPSLGVELEL